jgi:hypothetical protein
MRPCLRRKYPMNKIISISLLVAGIILIVFGFQASDSIGSSFSRLFTGTPTDKSIWLLIGGAALVVVGLVGVLRFPRD